MTFDIFEMKQGEDPPPLPKAARLTTRTGWNTSVDRVVEVPDLCDHPAGGPVADDDPRMLFHAAMRIVETPAIEAAWAVRYRLLRASRNREEGQPAIVIDGEHDTGMTVLLRYLGRQYQRGLPARLRRNPTFTPVVHINVPPIVGGAADLALLVADFLEMSFGKDPEAALSRIPDMSGPVRHRMAGAGTQLVLIDGVHRLSDSAAQSAVAFMTWLRDELAVTVVYCGVGAGDIVYSGLRGNRAADRRANHRGPYPVIETGPIPFTEHDHQTWLAVLRTLDDDLRLHQHKPGALLDLAPYQHHRSGGYITTLSYLVCEAAQLAIENGEEAITHDLLASLRVGRHDEDLDLS